MEFNVDKKNCKVQVVREFAAPLSQVWDAWTQKEILDKWWAPKPYQTVTLGIDFSTGGYWSYKMLSPEGDAHYCRADYSEVIPQKSFSGLDAFCNAEGNINMDFPRQKWNVNFEEQGSKTVVTIEIQYEKLEDLEKIIGMGFKEGFTMALGNLDELFAASTTV